ncbi:hypothetical protein [Shewanella algae]|uniref:hypothetical protein n=1 Tax=Shewanella algae TaxID=38313 RepID=UPI001AAFC6E5|nr:hypothetical protein [Shewanella algae]MBO2583582.1 hypothetical protein [Shewanella algae]
MKNNIEPSKVTKPIQLLAAWLAGLTFVNGTFLATAVKMDFEYWGTGALIIAAILNVPLFIFALFLLQTKFRPEMQEDSYYSRYLETRTSTETELVESVVPPLKVENLEDIHRAISELSVKLVSIEGSINTAERKVLTYPDGNVLLSNKDKLNKSLISINDLLPSYSNIVDALEQKGIELTQTFGSSGSSDVPDKFVVSCGNNINVEEFQYVLSACRKFGAKYVSFSDGSMHENRIYIGSYSYKNTKNAKLIEIDDSLNNDLFDHNLSMPKLKYLLTK